MVIKTEVRRDAYYDSFTLMMGSSRMSDVPGVQEAMAFMGTTRNDKVIRASGLVAEGTPSYGASDTVIGIRADSEEAVTEALRVFDAFLEQKQAPNKDDIRAKTLAGAKRLVPGINFTVISVPGGYAKHEVENALDLGMHVLLFSDNVSLDEEIALKDDALEKGLLMMGPDCGTAIVNGVALGFANVVNRGNIGLVAAAGTGLQEVTVLIDRLGGGVSQALGTGGRDLKEPVGGKMMMLCLEALRNDPATEVIVIISKPPHPSALENIKQVILTIDKPVVACLLGADSSALEGTGARFASDLEQAAHIAMELAGFKSDPVDDNRKMLEALAEKEAAQFADEQVYLRGLYSGGTLCYETLLALDRAGVSAYSNIALKPEMKLKEVERSKENTLLDMGDDYFTDGMPHPMIDPRMRIARIEQEANDPEVAVLLLDCVGGYGSHDDPAGAMAPAISTAIVHARNQSRHLCVIASVCATENDPQKRSVQEQTLRDAGAIVTDCNAQAARLASLVILAKTQN